MDKSMHETVAARIAAGEGLSDVERAHATGCDECAALERTRDVVASGLGGRRRREPPFGFDARVVARAAEKARRRQRMFLGGGILGAVAVAGILAVVVMQRSSTTEVASSAAVEDGGDARREEVAGTRRDDAGLPAAGPREGKPNRNGFGLPPPHLVERFADDLDLKPAQRTQIRDVLDDGLKRLTRIAADREIKEIDIRREFSRDDADEKKVATMIDELAVLEAEARKVDLSVWMKVRKILSKDQRTKLERLIERDLPAHGGGPRDGAPPRR